MAVYNENIPSAVSLDEFGMYTINEIEEEYHNLNRSIGLEELALLEAKGEQTNYKDGEKKNKFFDKIIGFIHKVMDMIKGLYNKALTAIQGAISNFKKKISDSLVSKMKKNIGKLKDKGSYGKTWEYSGYESVVSGTSTMLTAVTKYQQTIAKKEDTAYQNYIKLGDKATENTVKQFKEMFTQETKALASEIGSKGDSIDAKDVKEAVLKQVRGKEIQMTKSWIVSNIEVMSKSATDFGYTAKQVKSQFDAVKKDFNDLEKKVKDDKTKQKGVSEQLYSAYVAAIKQGITYTTSISNATVVAVREKIGRDCRVVAKLAHAMGNIDNMKGAVNKVKESATFETQLDSLFDF